MRAARLPRPHRPSKGDWPACIPTGAGENEQNPVLLLMAAAFIKEVLSGPRTPVASGGAGGGSRTRMACRRTENRP
uniref:Uncharacterized protein n=1 Tax=Siphoviridae sp. ctBeL15 TaxID=2825374 RepID=A0A8S5V092_9CAUD|nr:MAG TPA: hypothetical protein [Siphoviridae sp. ctBeL15]